MRSLVLTMPVALLLFSCAANGSSSSGSGCPSDQTNLAYEVADQIESATVTPPVTPSVPPTVPGSGWRTELANEYAEGVYQRQVDEQEFRASWERYTPRMTLMTSAQWVDRFPGCFSDKGAVLLLALRDSVANTTEPLVMQTRVDHDALLAALRTP